jgi:hypothetical protein
MSPAELAATVYAPPPAADAWTLPAIVGHDRLRYYSLGRWALVEALRIAGAGPGKKVLLPGYLCREVVASVHELGAEPIFYEVTPGLGLAESHVRLPDACAIMAVNYFGFPQDLSPFTEYCWRTGALLIEDNAHGLFSKDSSGASLGARAAMGVFSLRKTLPLPNGAALALNDAALAPRIPPQLPSVIPPPSRRRYLRALAPLLGARGAWACINLGRRVRSLKSGSHLPAPDPEGEQRIPGSAEPCAELSRPLRALDPAKEAERRRSLYHYCEDLLAGTGISPVFPRLPEGTVPYVYPFRAAPEQALQAEARLNAHGLSSLTWPDLPRAVVQEAPRHYRDVRGVHFLW